MGKKTDQGDGVQCQSSEFVKLMVEVSDLAARYPDSAIFIGGIAVYLHAQRVDLEALAEFTHDADLYMSLADMGDLRDAEEVTPNRRLSKHQLIRRGFEFDIYTERQSSLVVPYDEAAAHAVVYEGIRLASLEHLLVLKLAAYLDRRGSAKGQKDAKDILRIVAVAQKEGGFQVDRLLAHLTDEHLEAMREIANSFTPFALARGNAFLAKQYRSALSEEIEKIADKMNFRCSPTARVYPR